MGFMIEDGKGSGNRARVNNGNQLSTQAEVHELQHHISITDGQVYQAIGTHSLASSGAKPILHITNNDPERYLIVSYMRLQFPGGDGSVDENTYFQGGFGRTYSSGGLEVTPVNMNETSGNLANVSVYKDNPTLAGNISEFDSWYPDKGMHVFNKHGSLILGLSGTFEWRLVTDQSSGLAYVRVTFMMLHKDDI